VAYFFGPPCRSFRRRSHFWAIYDRFRVRLTTFCYILLSTYRWPKKQPSRIIL